MTGEVQVFFIFKCTVFFCFFFLSDPVLKIDSGGGKVQTYMYLDSLVTSGG